MTLPEFLAIAVKARRWVVVGDPAQLPPYNDTEDNAVTLDDVVPATPELACSTATLLARTRPAVRRENALVVVSSEPPRAVAAIRAHLRSVLPGGFPDVGLIDADSTPGIVVCAEADAETAYDTLVRSATHENVRVLVERGIAARRPENGSDQTLVECRERAHAALFEQAFSAYHSQPWARRTGQQLGANGFELRMKACTPSMAVLDAVFPQQPGFDEAVRGVAQAICTRFAINTVSVYDWLTGIATTDQDCSPLRELRGLTSAALQGAIRPYVGTLKKQYRMHPSLSRVPRELFYFGEALFDGRADPQSDCRVTLVQVESEAAPGEFNEEEVGAVCTLLESLGQGETAHRPAPSVMVITPYRRQEARLQDAINALPARHAPGSGEIEVCTLDRCQGREADYVFISLVRSRATAFFEMPKRWNVALTRAKEGLLIVGDIDSYIEQARSARRAARGRPPKMSLLARVIEAYAAQIREPALRRRHGNGQS